MNRELYVIGTLIQQKSDSEMRREGRGSIEQVVRVDQKIYLVKWFDNKSVLLMSSEHGKTPITKCKRWVEKEQVIPRG
ncbi:hypothetical protein TNCV_2503481 [Trichonephila clavipes]|nr:hypothetical protein TNCV_2503481 [Trichonephila clavipes]